MLTIFLTRKAKLNHGNLQLGVAGIFFWIPKELDIRCHMTFIGPVCLATTMTARPKLTFRPGEDLEFGMDDVYKKEVETNCCSGPVRVFGGVLDDSNF